MPTPLQGSPFRALKLPEPVLINEDFVKLLHNATYEKGTGLLAYTSCSIMCTRERLTAYERAFLPYFCFPVLEPLLIWSNCTLGMVILRQQIAQYFCLLLELNLWGNEGPF